MKRIRIAHISDLHFSRFALSPLQFFSKRWLGNFNLLLTRKDYLTPRQLEPLLDFFQELNVDTVIITGDLSTTSQAKEFSKGKSFLEKLQRLGLRVIAIPGNHDHYTKRAWQKKLYYDFLPDHAGWGMNLRKDGIAALDLDDIWTVVALDTALATPLHSSRGLFSEEHEEKLNALLSSIPQERQIIIVNHFPLFDYEKSTKILERAPALRNLLQKFPNVRFYLHGHTHRHSIADLRPNQLPIILDSGSVANNIMGSWNLLDLQPDNAKLQAYRNYAGDLATWQPFRKVSWDF